MVFWGHNNCGPKKHQKSIKAFCPPQQSQYSSLWICRSSAESLNLPQIWCHNKWSYNYSAEVPQFHLRSSAGLSLDSAHVYKTHLRNFLSESVRPVSLQSGFRVDFFPTRDCAKIHLACMGYTILMLEVDLHTRTLKIKCFVFEYPLLFNPLLVTFQYIYIYIYIYTSLYIYIYIYIHTHCSCVLTEVDDCDVDVDDILQQAGRDY